MVINLFVDTNAWLSFYTLSSNHSKTLNELLKKISSKEINLFIPSNQIDEIRRNKEEVIAKQINKISKFSQELKNIKKVPEIIEEDLTSFVENLTKTSKDYKKKAYEETLEVDKVLRKIIKNSKIIEINEGTLEQAKKRALIKGNPPRKKNNFKSCSDAINWESLLYVLNPKEKLVIISNDIDYCSEIDGQKISLFLKEEWKRIKKSDIRLYKTLGSFLTENFENTEISSEEVLSEESSSEYISTSEKGTDWRGIHWGAPERSQNYFGHIPHYGSDVPIAGCQPFSESRIWSLNQEKEVRCSKCNRIFYAEENSLSLKCPYCESTSFYGGGIT